MKVIGKLNYDMSTNPRYPIYIPSKGRAKKALTARCLKKEGVPFYLVLEESEVAAYEPEFGKECILVLPFTNPGSVIPARNWIKKHATEAGYERHWQLDDNIRKFRRWWRGKRIACDAALALRVCEDFTDRYENIAVSGLNYTMFAVGNSSSPFILNCHVYSCSLILNEIKNEWRGKYNEDTDMCLQVLADGWCTVLMNAFLCDKMRTLQMKGGNTTEIYGGDGRLKMARHLERLWPRAVTTNRRFGRPQHIVYAGWRKFDTQLIKKKGLVIDPEVNEYGMKLSQVTADIKSDAVKNLLTTLPPIKTRKKRVKKPKAE